MKKIKIHFVGIKGVGMAPLAILAKEAGFTVTGSDVTEEFITDAALKKAGIIPVVGFFKENIQNPDLVVITGAHGGYNNVEAKEAIEKKIRVITQGEAVGVFMQGDIFGKKFIGISVLGTHGKTTTTAMLATILKENKLDPSYVIGTGDISSIGAPGHFGMGKHFVAEADEYATDPKLNKKAKFLWQFPRIAILTNIEFDHPDIYANIENVRGAFLEFCNQLSKDAVLIVCGDDPEVRNLLKDFSVNVIKYGFNSDNDYILDKVRFSGENMFFRVSSKGMMLSEFMVKVVGEHNALNSLSAIIASLELGLSIDKIKKGIFAFAGSQRRLEFIGELETGAYFYDDYAHHPTELKKTLQALRSQYPNKKIIALFQPHTFSRTKKLFDEFIRSFISVDTVILTDIYPSLREIPDLTITSQILTNKMKLEHKDVNYLPDLTDVVKYINEKMFRSDTVLVTMGAGDIYKIHSKLKFV